MKHRTWIYLSGLIWAIVGFLLLYKGLGILTRSAHPEAASWWIAAGLLVGFIKGRFVLSKTVHRISHRIASLPLPIRAREVYPKAYWLLLGSMMFLGFAMRYLPSEWRGFIDVAVGSALINGALLYARAARAFVAR